MTKDVYRMRIFLLFFLLLFIVPTNAQEEYSYVTDRRFFQPSDLIGYNFVPIKYEIPNEYDEELGPDEYSFGITFNNLYTKGGEIEGVYNINNINDAEYGFKLTLMNPRNPAQSGHLKVIVNDKRHVSALIFRKSKKEDEIIFHLPQAPEELLEEEQTYFTDNGELHIEDIDSIWGTEINPFLRVYTSDNIQQRLQHYDSTSIVLIEEIVFEEKKIKKKKKKNKKDQEEKEEELEAELSEEEEEEEEEEQVAVVDSLDANNAIIEDVEEKEFKEIRSYYFDYKTRRINKQGIEEIKVTRYQIKKTKERVNEDAGPGEEKYQLAFMTEQGDELYIYLLENRTVSSLEIKDELLFLRGY